MKGVNVNEFDLVVAGSSLWAGQWTRRMNGFLKGNAGVLAAKNPSIKPISIRETSLR